MRIRQWRVTDDDQMAAVLAALRQQRADLGLVFGGVGWFETAGRLHRLTDSALAGHWLGCSTAGEIAGAEVFDRSLVISAVNFDRPGSRTELTTTRLTGMSDSLDAGRRLAAALPGEGLRGVWLVGVGVEINGSALVQGLQQGLSPGVRISGGLAADDGAFHRTWTLCDRSVGDDQLVALGWYGDNLLLDNSSFGGWEPFGPERKVTRCVENVLFELDRERALDIYKRYLGEYARGLPASGLLFPFEMIGADRKSNGVIRTVQAVNEEDGSMTLAGDIDPSGFLKLMHASTDRLIGGAEKAAQAIRPSIGDGTSALAILVSCVGRRLVMGDRAEEELEVVVGTLGPGVVCTGFYSNGEISEGVFSSGCRFYNQTMTITLVGEL